MYDHERDVEHGWAKRERTARPGTPGRATLTARMPPTAAAIARAVVTQLRLSQLDDVTTAADESPHVELDEAP